MKKKPEIELAVEEERVELSKSKVLWIHGIRRIQYQVI